METSNSTPILTGWEAVFAGRKTGVFYLHDAEPMAVKLVRVLQKAAAEFSNRLATDTQRPEFEGLVRLDDPVLIGRIVSLFAIEHETTRGPGITLRRVTKTEHDKIKAICKGDRRMVNGQWADGAIDEDAYALMHVSAAIVDPEIPVTVPDALAGEERERAILQAKAEWVRNHFGPFQLQELVEACKELDAFNLRRIEDIVKN